MDKILQQILEEIRGVARFRWYGLLAAWVVCLIGWTAVMMMPDIYGSSARLYVNARTVLAPALQGLTINQDVEAQLNLVRQSLLGRPHLEKVGLEAGVFPVDMPAAERTQAVFKLRDQIRLNIEGRDPSGGTVYTVAYQHEDREVARKVVEILLNAFVEDVLGGKRSGSQTVQSFLAEQIQEYEQRLRQAEQRLADFKRRNVGQMPGEQGDYFTRLQAEMAAVNKARGELTIAQTRRDELARQLRGEAANSVTIPGALGGPTGETAQRIREAQARLDELLLRFTPKHPDVIAAQETLEQLRQRQEAELEAIRRGDPEALITGTQSSNPVLQNIQLALRQADVEVAALRSEIADRERTVAELRKLVDTVPDVEAELARLNRDYDVTRSQYLALVDRLERARLGDVAEETESISFRIIDPPAASFRPIAPKRPKLMAMVMVAGIAAGAGLAYLLHLLKPVFNSARSVSEITGFPVLGVVSMAWQDRYRSRLYRSYVAYSVSAALLIGLFVIALQFGQHGVRMLQSLTG
jgi:polysaccharide chain length determinant protein (PEP-CTERM system associated)